ncbi:nucleotide-diphospho-sugar transferase [Hygrophoropsis aurantiaca]|uniref:Nucleotide-diphospho-sugar transferase n=1 Tax=Hygrophoropsis aurantiaca TaxID=72124 RepID=A0ACB8AT61_9AGAM|nr:nucleotide-diphospho-sugar transferase [Hygrophoropsis aurantiaca]
MSANYAFVTLLTSDSYLPGALTLASALKDVDNAQNSDLQIKYDIVCLVTPATLDQSSIKFLRRTFDVVIGVETIYQRDDKGLNLLGRPDLKTVLTKLHIFRLTQYSKIIFLDADVLPIRPLSHLFSLDHEFSAVPDVGWPDIFNSGVMVLSPGEDKFSDLQNLLKAQGSWDGGDQGILNEWRGDNWNKLSFIYNTTPTAAYTYAPAYERFGSKISAIHFIGPNKPWHSIPFRAPGSSSAIDATNSNQQRVYSYESLVDRWYGVYDAHYRSHAVSPDTEFDVHKYPSVWNKESAETAKIPPSPTRSSGGVFGLDELRRLAIQGMTALKPRQESQIIGEYPKSHLSASEGRFEMMRPVPNALPLEESAQGN